MKIIQPRKDFKDWMDDETRTMVRDRDAAREKARKSRLDEDWKKFKTIRNKCTLAIRNRKKKHLAEVYLEIERNNDSKSLYNLTKNHLGWKTGGPPQSFLIEGKTVSAPSEMAQEQLKYFNRKIEKLINDLPPKTEDPLKILKDRIEKLGSPATRKKLALKTITEIDTLRLINKLGNSTAFGADLIDSKSIKVAVLHLYKPITYLINLSIQQGIFPSRWKQARLIPLHKGKGADRQLTKSYRPISLLSPVSKLAEKAVQEQLLTFLEETNQLNLNLHAYRKDTNTTTAMIQISDTILEATDKNLVTTLVTVDESAAFDCVSTEILLSKLELYNLDRQSIKWIKSYLTERSQFVQIGAKKSDITPVNRGVPQGSVLGPILYSVYTNELPEVIVSQECTEEAHQKQDKLFSENCTNCGSLPCFADDATYIVSRKTRSELQDKITENMDKIKKFLNNNDLTVNTSKTKMLEVMVKQKRTKMKGTQPEIVTTNEAGEELIIRPDISLRILGGNFHRNLSWTAHLEVGEIPLLPTLRKRLGALKHLSKGIPKKCRLILANGFIMSKIVYLIPLWGGTYSRQMGKVQTLMNMTARWINDASRKTKTSILMEKCKWLNIRELIKYHSAIAIWKILKSGKPEHLRSRITLDEEGLMVSRNPRLQTTGLGLLWRGQELWNSIPQEAREAQTIARFKTNIKKWIMETRNITNRNDIDDRNIDD